uniref:Si:dkey-31j3.11 n=1 Tax=Sinocyclocheilus rhinocerous TaxID=307959 RepID=A0A673LKI9_9TELE
MLVFSFISDTKRAVGLLKQYQASLTSPEEQTLKTSVEKVSSIFGSHLFQALLGEGCFCVWLSKQIMINCHYLGLYHLIPVHSIPSKMFQEATL